MKFTILPILFFLLQSICGYGQTFRYTSQQIKEDIIRMRSLLIRYHPNAQTVDFQEQFDNHFGELTSSSSISAQEAYQLIASFLPIIKDGHTILTAPKKSWKPCYQAGYHFPLDIYWDGSDLYSVKNWIDSTNQLFYGYESPDISPGSKLLSINGIDSEDLIQKMISSLMRDDDNENYPTWVVNQFFQSYLVDIYGCKEMYQITYENSEGVVVQDSISGIEPFFIYSKDELNKKQKGIYLSFEEQYATLSLRSWHKRIIRKEYKQKLKTELINTLERVIDSKVENLIIDLRDNQGGDMNLAILALSYLLDHPFEIIQRTNRMKKGVLKEVETKQTGIHQPNQKQFAGNLYVLTNGGSFSNTGIFCAALQKYNRATFIGSETGGSAFALCYGPYNFKLKHTQIAIKIPVNQAILQPLKGKAPHGVKPDHQIIPTINDVLEDRDVIMEFTTDLIQNQSIEK